MKRKRTNLKLYSKNRKRMEQLGFYAKSLTLKEIKNMTAVLNELSIEFNQKYI